MPRTPAQSHSDQTHNESTSALPLGVEYPFAAVVGNQAAKRALLLLAIEPGLRGVLIASEGGSGNSTLARGFATLDSIHQKTDSKLVELPVSVTEDRLLGGLDLERTLATGKRELATGLLARADGGVVFADNINLLDDSAATHLAHAISSHEVRIEREGLSAVERAEFRFIGTYNRAEGEVNPLLRDSVGLIVESRSDYSEYSAEEKAEIIARAFRFDKHPHGFIEDFGIETAEIESLIEEARTLLPRIRVSRDQMRQIAMIAMKLGVEGNRADVFAVKAARANAALEGRDSVTEDDFVAAIQLVLVPRATRIPSEADTPRSSDSQQQQDSDRDKESVDQETLDALFEDLILPAVEAQVPIDALSVKRQTLRSSGRGKSVKSAKSARGRYVRSAVHREGDARVAIDATLRAAAPYQLTRRTRQPARSRVTIAPGDLRFKEFKHRSGVLFIFAVDASGSMAINRMAQAKGALTRLLQQAYLHRDKVALISFRGKSSEVLLAPTRSVELAKRLVDGLPAGGGTPISAGVMMAIELARVARIQGMPQAMLVLFTDGRANVSASAARTPFEELEQLGRLLQSERITSVVIDTKSKFVSGCESQSLAALLGAGYFYLPRSKPRAVYEAISAAVSTERGSLKK